MLGLGAYESSSEDEIEAKPSPELQDLKKSPVEVSQTPETKTQQIPDVQTTGQEPVFDQQPSGPVLGPSHEETQTPHPLEEQAPTLRTLIHNLTLPPVPNLDIPPSPPGSPDPSANAKFAHFLSLKKQNVHFNEKLAGSASLKNPSLLKKLMEHAGIDEQAQYCSSLPPDLWDITSLPSWGYKEELLKAQKEINSRTEERKARGQREAIEFVTAESSRSGCASHPKSRPR